MNAKDKLATARLMACNKFGYFRTAIMAMVPKPVDGLGTFGVTDDGVLLYDPKRVEQWTVEEVAAVLVHEVSHLLRKHSARRERLQADPMIWNQAADAEINDDLVAARLRLPSFKEEDGTVIPPIIPQNLTPPMPTGLTAEEYLPLFRKRQQQQASGSGQGKPKKGQQGKGKGQGQPQPDDAPEGKGGGQGEEPKAGCGWCGSAAGRALPNEPQAKGESQGRSEVELERIRRSVAESIRDEVAKKGQGRVPGGWQRWANETLKPAKVRWQDKLARVTRAAIAYRSGAVDYKFTHPSRRQAGLGYGAGVPILPALRAPVPKIAVVQDTSGSMGTEELSAGLPEVDGILRAVGGMVTFVACDADVHVLQPVRHWKDLLKLMKGGGGTDFVPAFEALAKQQHRPDVVVFITDGAGRYPEVPPNFRVVWLLCGSYRIKASEVPFGEVIELDEVA